MHLDPVTDLVAEQLPFLAGLPVRYLTEGCDSWTYEIGDERILRLPRHASAERGLLMQAELLPRLAPRIPLEIPVPDLVGRPSGIFPRHFTSYPKVPGVDGRSIVPVPGTAKILGRFLSDLHAYPIDARPTSVPPADEITPATPEAWRETALDGLADARAAAPGPWTAVEAVLDEEPPPAYGGAPRLIHNDLDAEHILLDPESRQPRGIIDWADAAIGDPAVDFAGIARFGGEAILRHAVGAYRGPVDDGLRDRARYVGLCLAVDMVATGARRARPEWIEEEVRGIELLAGEGSDR